VSDTEITVASPPGSKPTVPVTVTTAGGTSPVNANTMFSYGRALTLVRPSYGVGSGGTTVVIVGSNLKGATAVNFGTTSATTFTVKSATKIVALSPPGTGTVDVTVVGPGGTSPVISTDQFDYAAAVTHLSPAGGKAAGGTTVTITGTNFTGTTAVDFGTTAAASFTVISDKKIKAVAPPGTGSVDVTVVSLGGTSPATVQFTYR